MGYPVGVLSCSRGHKKCVIWSLELLSCCSSSLGSANVEIVVKFDFFYTFKCCVEYFKAYFHYIFWNFLGPSHALCSIWPHFLVDTTKIWQCIMNLYNLYKKLSYSDFGRIHKATVNRPLKLGQFFNFSEFSLFYWLKLSILISFGKRNGFGCFFGQNNCKDLEILKDL